MKTAGNGGIQVMHIFPFSVVNSSASSKVRVRVGDRSSNTVRTGRTGGSQRHGCSAAVKKVTFSSASMAPSLASSVLIGRSSYGEPILWCRKLPESGATALKGGALARSPAIIVGFARIDADPIEQGRCTRRVLRMPCLS